MDFVFTVCDQAAGEICPVWPGNRSPRIGACPTRPLSRAAKSTAAAFRNACRQLEARIKLFVALPIDKLDRLTLKRRADQIGRHRITRKR